MAKKNDYGVTWCRENNVDNNSACLQKTKKDLSRDRTCQISIMRILNKDLTEEERDDVLATIKKASVDVTDVLSEFAAIIRALAPTFFLSKRSVSHRN